MAELKLKFPTFIPRGPQSTVSAWSTTANQDWPSPTESRLSPQINQRPRGTPEDLNRTLVRGRPRRINTGLRHQNHRLALQINQLPRGTPDEFQLTTYFDLITVTEIRRI